MTGILCGLTTLYPQTPAAPPAGALAVSVSPSSVSGSGTSSTISTSTATATASGGTAPYTYAWTHRSGDGSTSATRSSSAGTAFQRSGCTAGNSYSSGWTVTVTDSSGATATATASARITCNSSGGGGGGGGGGSTVNWADIVADGTTATITGTNADQTMTAGTLNFSVAFGDTTFNYAVFKNSVSQGTNISSLAVSNGDLVHFSASVTGPSGTFASGTITITGGASDSFAVFLSRN